MASDESHSPAEMPLRLAQPHPHRQSALENELASTIRKANRKSYRAMAGLRSACRSRPLYQDHRQSHVSAPVNAGGKPYRRLCQYNVHAGPSVSTSSRQIKDQTLRPRPLATGSACRRWKTQSVIAAIYGSVVEHLPCSGFSRFSGYDIQDRDGAGPLPGVAIRAGPCPTRLADSGYQGPRVAAASSIRVEIVRKPDGQVGFAVHARRWVVERFFAWINRHRRLAKDFEATIASATAFLYAASAILLLRRLARC